MIELRYRRLRERYAWLEAVLAAVPDAVWLKDADGVYLACNKAFERLAGRPQHEILGRTDHDLFGAEDADQLRANDQLVLLGRAPLAMEESLRQPGGEPRLYASTKTVAALADGTLIGVVGIAHDITEQRRMEQNMRLAAITFQSQEGIFITDAQTTILRSNRAFTQITGYAAEEIAGQQPTVLKSGRHGEAFYKAMWRGLREAGAWQGEVVNRRKDGADVPHWLTITSVTDRNGKLTHYVAILSDLSERKAAAAQIEQLSLYDALTGLPNRKLMFDRLDRLTRARAQRPRQGAVLLLDLDNVKALNDGAGHAAGDALLAAVAQRLSARLRDGDTAARIGGDEFLLLLDDLDPGDAGLMEAEAFAAEILRDIAAPLVLPAAGGTTVTHSASAGLGVVLFEDAGSSAPELLARAETAMYQAKAAGRGQLRFFDPRVQAAADARAALEAELRQAIAERQLVLHYQPQVDGTGRVAGAEALVRWQHPRRGLLPPGDFIPQAEACGLIVPMGEWILQAACRQLAAWAGDPALARLRVAVNVSARQFATADLPDQVRAALSASGADPTRLTLELTETLLLEDPAGLAPKLDALKRLGIAFLLDDFGTGFSSLSHLKHLPLDGLKIDRSFVQDVEAGGHDAAIARAVIALGSSLGLRVVAEGVETAGQQAVLAAAGCRYFQGYLFSPPLPAGAFEAFVRNRTGG